MTSAHANGTADKAKGGGEATTRRPPRKYSPTGDILFAAFLALYGGLMYLSFAGKIPSQPWEQYSLKTHIAWAEWMSKLWWLPCLLSIAYIVLTFGTQSYMATRKPFDLRMPLALWSLALAVFSLMGSVRTVPAMVKVIRQRGVEHLVCGDTRFDWLVNDPAGFWTLIFCLSKIPELIDTAFIVLHKKQLITLHWYHHFTVMLFCWQSWSTCCVNGIIFAAMNLSVHTVMYMFYALAAIGYRPTTFAQSITVGQIAQMVVGTAVTAYVTMDKLFWHPVQEIDFSMTVPPWAHSNAPDMKKPCHVSSGNALAGFLMYGSYLALFVEFFISAYLVKGGKAKGE